MNHVQHIRCLTPLRGIAALIVVVYHYQLYISAIVPRGQTHLFDKLYLMVDLFFILSGFIMYHVYGSTFQSRITKTDFFHFMRSRFARIYPLHLVTLLYLIGLSLVVTATNTHLGRMWEVFLDKSAIPSQLLLTQAMGTHLEATWNTASWAISVQWWAYVVFPFLMIFLARTKMWSRWVFAGAIVSGYLLIMYSLQPAFFAKRWVQFNIPESVPYPIDNINVITGGPGFLRCLCGFIFGMLIYEFYRKEWGKTFLKSGFVFLACWLLLFVLWHYDVLPDPAAVFIFGVIIISVAYNNDRVGEIFNRRPFQFTGDLSYSLYLIHNAVFTTFILVRKIVYQPDSRALGVVGYNFTLYESWVGLFIYLFVTILISYLTHKYLEKPARLYLKKGKR